MKPNDPASPFDAPSFLPGSAPLAELPPILVADDSEDDRYFTMRLLQSTGLPYPILRFDDGLAVVDYLTRSWLDQKGAAAGQPRLLFLDLKMAGLSGFSVLEWAREHRARAALTIVILSGSDEPRDVERARRLGANRYLAKHPSLATFALIVDDAHRPDPEHRGRATEPFFVPNSSQWLWGAGDELRRRRW